MGAFETCRSTSCESSVALPAGPSYSRDATAVREKQWGAAVPTMLMSKCRNDKMSGMPRGLPRAPLALEYDDVRTWLLDSEPGHPSRRLIRQLSPQSVMEMLEMERFEAIPEPPTPSRQIFPLVHEATAYCHSRNQHWTDELVWSSMGAAPMGSCLANLDAEWRAAQSFLSGWHWLCLGPES